MYTLRIIWLRRILTIQWNGIEYNNTVRFRFAPTRKSLLRLSRGSHYVLVTAAHVSRRMNSNVVRARFVSVATDATERHTKHIIHIIIGMCLCRILLLLLLLFGVDSIICIIIYPLLCRPSASQRPQWHLRKLEQFKTSSEI